MLKLISYAFYIKRRKKIMINYKTVFVRGAWKVSETADKKCVIESNYINY